LPTSQVSKQLIVPLAAACHTGFKQAAAVGPHYRSPTATIALTGADKPTGHSLTA
jgi:hypothetical protein